MLLLRWLKHKQFLNFGGFVFVRTHFVIECAYKDFLNFFSLYYLCKFNLQVSVSSQCSKTWPF